MDKIGMTMITSRGQEVSVQGVLTSNKKYLIGATARSYVGPWKPASTGSGNDTRSIGFGDISVYRAEEKDGVITQGDLVIGPLGFRSNETKDPQDKVTVSINSFLTDAIGFGKNAKKFNELISPEISSSVSDAIEIAVDDLEANGPAKNSSSRYSSIALKLAKMAEKVDAKRSQSTTPTEESTVQGTTVGDVTA
jgi:hypothetical protein